MKLNKPLIEKMCVDMLANPESYDQQTAGSRFNDPDHHEYGLSRFDSRPRPAPACGSVTCLMGQAVISNEATREAGVRKMYEVLDNDDIAEVAIDLTGLPDALFGATCSDWPEPYRSEWREANTYIDQTNAAVRMLRAVIKTDGKILEAVNEN